jgi:hypothetical protein
MRLTIPKISPPLSALSPLMSYSVNMAFTCAKLCVCVCVCVCARARVCVCVCVAPDTHKKSEFDMRNYLRACCTKQANKESENVMGT